MHTRTTKTALALGALVATVGVAAPATAEPAPAPNSCSWSVVDAPTAPSGTVLRDVDVVDTHDARITGTNLAPAQPPWQLRWNGRRLVDDQPVPTSPLVTLQPWATSYSSGREGWALVETGARQFAEHWNGRRWTLTPLAVTPDAATTDYYVEDVATLSPTDAWVVGASYQAGTDVLPKSKPLGVLIEHWDGRRWQTAPNPAADQPDTKLLAITARSASDVWAVGYERDADGDNAPFTEHFDGASWTVVPAPAGNENSTLSTVSIGTDGALWAAGHQTIAGGGNLAAPLAERWDGSAWQAVSLPDVGNAQIDRIYVAGANAVWAIVEVPSGANQLLHWDGSAWTTVPLPGPPEYGLRYFYQAIDGSGPDDVWAVGEVTDLTNADTVPQVAHLHCGRG